MENIIMIGALFVILHLALPILGLIYLGYRRERRQYKYMLQDSLKALHIVRVGRGNRK